jgi:nitrogen fixation protein FixH
MSQVVKKLTGRRVFIYLCLFFGVIAAVNAVFITKALQSNSGVVNDNPYERGIGYNKILAEHEKEQALGWKIMTAIENKKTLVCRIIDKNGKPIDKAHVVAHMLRPVQKDLDFDLPLVETKEGRYVANLKLPVNGAWNVHISVERGEDRYNHLTSLDIE